MEVVAPSSVPILVMVARSGTERSAMAGPSHSIILPTPPLTERISSNFKLTSLAETYGGNLPVQCTLIIFGMVM